MTGDQTVPDALMGCWRRNWIQFRTNSGELAKPDPSVTVIWLQTASGMGDLRLDPNQAPHQTDSSCGITVVETTQLEDGSSRFTADWLDGPTGFAQQPVSNFPEKGWLTWDSPTIMHERAPSGAYIEEWELLPDSSGDRVHLTAPEAPTLTNLYIAGRHHFLAVQAADGEPLHQFSYGFERQGKITTQHSTIADLTGSTMKIDYDWITVSRR